MGGEDTPRDGDNATYCQVEFSRSLVKSLPIADPNPSVFILPKQAITLERWFEHFRRDQRGANPGYFCGRPGKVDWPRIRLLHKLAKEGAALEPYQVRAVSDSFIDRKKFYAYPCYNERAFLENVAGYFTEPGPGPSDKELWWDAIEEFRKDSGLKGKKIRPVSWQRATKQINRPANSGLPEFTRKGDVVDNTKGGLAGVETNLKLPPIAGVRTQGGKDRLICMVSLGIVKAEIRWILGFQEYVTPRWDGCVWVSPPKLAIRLKSRCPGPNFWSLDWEAYDQRINKFEVVDVFNCIFGNSWDWRPIVEYSLTSPILTHVGLTSVRRRSVASGMEHTNPIETPLNQIRFTYGVWKTGLDIDPLDVSVQGDDLLSSTGDTVLTEDDVQAFADVMSTEFNAVLNPEKQGFTEGLGVYLKRWWNSQGGHFFIGRVAHTLAFVERRVKRFKRKGAFSYFKTLWLADGIDRLRTCNGAEKIIDTLRGWDEYSGDAEAAKDHVDDEAAAEAQEEFDRNKYKHEFNMEGG